MPKVRYATDSDNRLVRIKEDGKNRREVTSAKGEFHTEGCNNLIYRVTEGRAWKRQFDFPDKVRFKGKWRLNQEHDLELVLDDAEDRFGSDVLTLKGEISDARSDELDFLITSKKDRGVETKHLLKLSGKWQADSLNRLGFLVSKEGGRNDIVLLGGAWEVGDNYEIIYRYRKTRLKRKIKEERALIFKGFWRITRKDRIAYVLDTSGKSGFLFKAQLENCQVSRKAGTLRYKIGAGLAENKRAAERIIKFFGTVRYNLTKKDQLVLELAGARDKEIRGIIELNRKILGGETFVRFKKLAEESKVEAGIKIPW